MNKRELELERESRLKRMEQQMDDIAAKIPLIIELLEKLTGELNERKKSTSNKKIS